MRHMIGLNVRLDRKYRYLPSREKLGDQLLYMLSVTMVLAPVFVSCSQISSFMLPVCFE